MDKPEDKTDFVAAPPPNAEIVDAVEKPQRAKVADAEETASEKLERKRDYLEVFLQKKPEAASTGEPGGVLYESVIDALKDIYDPEIPVNIYDLGLIYETERLTDGDVKVLMTLTAPACPVAGEMPYDVAAAVSGVEGVGEVEVMLTWEPAWTPDKMSEDAKLILNMY